MCRDVMGETGSIGFFLWTLWNLKYFSGNSTQGSTSRPAEERGADRAAVLGHVGKSM